MQTPPDLLYILGTGSLWQNEEIRYSLRSVEKFLPHGRIFIVGHLPKWARNVIHIPAEDPTSNKLLNSIHKTKVACKDRRMGERFAVMNDDFFFLEPVPEIKPYQRGNLGSSIRNHPTKNGYYFEAAKLTRRLLRERGIAEPKDYAVHYPLVIERKKALQLIEEIGDRPVLFRTMYANIHRMGGRLRRDVKMRSMDDIRKRDERNSQRRAEMISSDDALATSKAFRGWLKKRFPEKCRYEKNEEPDIMDRPRAYHVHRRFTWGSRTYLPGEIVEGRISKKIIRINGLREVREKPGESGGEY